MSNTTKQRSNKKTGLNSFKSAKSFSKTPSKNGSSPIFGSRIAGTPQKRKIKVGNTYPVKITALVSNSNNFGLNEFSYGFPILIGGLGHSPQEAKASLGDVVQVKVLKIQKSSVGPGSFPLPSVTQLNQKYAIAKFVKVVKKATNIAQTVSSVEHHTSGDLLGKSFDVTIIKKGPKGTFLAQVPLGQGGPSAGGKATNFKLIINQNRSLAFADGANPDSYLGHKVTVQVTRVKSNYGFAKLTNTAGTPSLTGRKGKDISKNTQASSCLKEGTKFTLTLPKKAKMHLKHIVIKLNILPTAGTPTILFLKPFAGAKLGDKVQIQIVKAWQNIAIGRIYQINPFSSQQKKAFLKANVQNMVNSGMHYGEQAIKCNARMRNYVLYTRTGASKGRAFFPKGTTSSNFLSASSLMGQRPSETPLGKGKGSSLSFPGMEKNAYLNKPLIQKGRNIINLLKTRRCLNKALAQLTKYAAKGKTFLFVGTKKAAAGLIARASLFSKKAFFVNTRWLGGMLTNWKTILKSISKIRPILKEKQVIIRDILEKRQSIKNLLMEKSFLLKKKSLLVLKKGKELVQKLKKNQGAAQNQKTSLVSKQLSLFQKGQVLLEKRQYLLQKRKALIAQSQGLYKTAFDATQTSKELVTKATIIRKKLRELKSLLFVSQQLQKIQQNQVISSATSSGEGKANIYTVSFNQYKGLNNSLGNVIPNPPKEILNKMVLFIKQNTLETSNISKKQANASVFVQTLFLSQFSSFAPSIKLSIKLLLTNLKEIQTKLVLLQDSLKLIVVKMQTLVNLKNNILTQLRQIQQSLVSQRNIIRVVKRKLKQISAQKRLIQFLPKLRFLPTPSTQISQTVQVLMKKIVDPKLKYPIDSIYDQKLSSQSKKVAAMRKKKWQRLEKYLGGISNMTKMNPNQIRNNVAIIVGQQEEANAVRECQKLGIKMFHIVDTNCNPGFADHFIPANDDSRNSIKYILTLFLTRIILAQRIKKSLSYSYK